MLASQDFHWTDYAKKVHKFKPCSVRMKRLKVRDNPKKKVFTITPTNVPTFYLPLFLNNFDLLDCQGPAEQCRATKANGLANIYFFLQQAEWVKVNYSGLGPKNRTFGQKIKVQSSGVLRRPQNLSYSKKANVLCDCNHDMTVCQKVPKADFSKLIFKVKIHPNLFIIFFN